MKQKFLLSVMTALLLCTYSIAQTDSYHSFLISISDPNAIQYISANNTEVYPVFNNPQVNAVVSSCHIYQFEKAFPASRFDYMQQLWRVKTSCASLAQDLKNADPQLFIYSEETKDASLLIYTPNDWTVSGYNMYYLDFVHARNAWGYTHGDTSVVIGITDNFVDTANPDLGKQKFASVGPNIYTNGSEPAHGTMVCGYAAGRTDNNYGLPAMGFNCRIDFSNLQTDGEMLNLSLRGRKVLNGSWYNRVETTPNLTAYPATQMAYNEIYENGTTAVFAAGNGDAGVNGPATFLFPASYDHNISVTNIGWENPYGGSNPFNQQYVHVKNVGSPSSFQHNSLVDIGAPCYNLSGLDYDPANPAKHLQNSQGWGTSFGSPIVAGCMALMVARNSCLTPYQREYLLKVTANNTDVYNKPENAPYLGLLGAGLMNAGAAMDSLLRLDCNDSVTRTFYVKGVKINTICKPGYTSNGVKPVLTPILENGRPPYTYRWMPLPGNNANLDYTDIATPTVIASFGNNTLLYLLTVYDSSPVPKVASKTVRVKLSADSTTFDLAMRDAYTDMMFEPNGQVATDPRDWNIWESPDIWNRQHNDSVMEHQNPEYFNNDPNYLYVVIRNIGCKVSPVTVKASMYWTLAATGEHWPMHWDGSTYFMNQAGVSLPAGGNLYAAAGGTFYVDAALQPGDTILKMKEWYPPKPQEYDAGLTNGLAVCVLARIQNNNIGPVFGLPFAEVANVSNNVRENNNIITRNMIVTNMDTGNKHPTHHMIAFGNPEDFAATYSLQAITDRDIQLHFAGNISEYAYVKLYLGDLFDIWQAGGGKGNYASMDVRDKTVTYDPATPLRLDNIRLEAGERYYIYVDLVVRDKPEGSAPVTDQHIHIRQLAVEKDKEYVYGDVSFAVNISLDGSGKPKLANTITAQATPMHNYEVFPNPASNLLNIRLKGKENAVADVTVTDVTGRSVISCGRIAFDEKRPCTVKIATLPAGTYIVSVREDGDILETFKITKTE